MTKNEELKPFIFSEKKLRSPDLSIGGFELWVNGLQFPDADDYWDGNWLMVMACCTGNSSVVQAAGPILHLSELHNLMIECKQIYATLSGEAHLKCMEPNVGLKIKMTTRGCCELLVSITPDNLYQAHSFRFDLDQSYLPPLIQNLEKIFHLYPFKGE